MALCLIQRSQLTPLPFSPSTSPSSPLWETAVWWIGGVGCHFYWWKANIYSVCHLKASPSSACQFNSANQKASRNTPAFTNQTLWAVYSYWQKRDQNMHKLLKTSTNGGDSFENNKKQWIPHISSCAIIPMWGKCLSSAKCLLH